MFIFCVICFPRVHWLGHREECVTRIRDLHYYTDMSILACSHWPSCSGRLNRVAKTVRYSRWLGSFFNIFFFIVELFLSTVLCSFVVSWIGLHQPHEQPHCPALPPVSVLSGSLPPVRQCTAPLPLVHATGNTSPSLLSNFKLHEDL